MITTNKDITYFLDEKGIGYNPVQMMILLGKLDHEDLEYLLNVLWGCCENEDGSI